MDLATLRGEKAEIKREEVAVHTPPPLVLTSNEGHVEGVWYGNWVGGIMGLVAQLLLCCELINRPTRKMLFYKNTANALIS
jgi:hypothetical protein